MDRLDTNTDNITIEINDIIQRINDNTILCETLKLTLIEFLINNEINEEALLHIVTMIDSINDDNDDSDTDDDDDDDDDDNDDSDTDDYDDDDDDNDVKNVIKLTHEMLDDYNKKKYDDNLCYMYDHRMSAVYNSILERNRKKYLIISSLIKKDIMTKVNEDFEGLDNDYIILCNSLMETYNNFENKLNYLDDICFWD